MRNPRKIAALGLAALLLAGPVLTAAVLTGPAHAAPIASVPASGQLSFDVIRNGKDVGDYSLSFQEQGEALTVNIKTDVAVKVPVIGVALYRFEQTSTEHWTGGRLQSLRSKTNDNGTAHDISTGPSLLIPASLWNAEIVRQNKVLNTINSGADSITVRAMGREEIATGHGKVSASRYSLSGGLNRELWFDDSGQLVHVRFAAEDGSTIDYVLR